MSPATFWVAVLAGLLTGPAGPARAPARLRAHVVGRPVPAANGHATPPPLATATLGGGAPTSAARIIPARMPSRSHALSDVLHSNVSVSSALSTEWDVLLAADTVYLPLGGLGVLLWTGSHGTILSAPVTFVLVRSAVQLALRSAGAARPINRPAARLAAVASASALVRAILLVSSCAALLLTSSTLSACAVAASLLGTAQARLGAWRRRRALAATGVAPSPAPKGVSVVRLGWLREAWRHLLGAAATLALAATELLWACEEGARVLAWACERLFVAWLPGLLAYLRGINYAESAASAAAFVGSLPDYLNYQANIRGLQFENFLADSWVRSRASLPAIAAARNAAPQLLTPPLPFRALLLAACRGAGFVAAAARAVAARRQSA